MNGKAASRSGSALVMVMVFTVLVGVMASIMVRSMGSRLRQSQEQLLVERAFYLAEGGAERAASYIAGNGALPATLEGSLGGGSYRTVVVLEDDTGGFDLDGRININPNNSPDNSFFTVLLDGSQIAREDLHQDKVDYTGEASMVHLQPKGSGQQNELWVNGSPYNLQNNQTYTFTGHLYIGITNDNRNPQGKAVGQWWISLNATNATLSSSAGGFTPRNQSFKIYSEGLVDGVKRNVTISGLRRVSWAKYAFWYDNESVDLWFAGGEEFQGPVYARPRMRFHSYMVSTHGQTRFYDRVWTSHHNIQLHNSSVAPIFDEDIVYNAPVDTMAAIDFNELRQDAALVLNGTTDIVLSNDVMFVTNDRAGWADEAVALPNNGLVYIQTVTTGANATRPGDVTVRAPDGLSGRLTIVAERDVLVPDHIRYVDSPLNNPNSTDALGLTAGRHTRVVWEAPDDLDIFAHILCRDGGFGVDDHQHSGRGQRGFLNVYGGIVNKVRNPVGSTSGTGYGKNYIYDQRFTINPPPLYPTISDEFQWTEWDG